MDGQKPAIKPNGTFHHSRTLMSTEGYVNDETYIFLTFFKMRVDGKFLINNELNKEKNEYMSDLLLEAKRG